MKAELDTLRSQQAGAKGSRSKILEDMKALQEENQKLVRLARDRVSALSNDSIDQGAPGEQEQGPVQDCPGRREPDQVRVFAFIHHVYT